LKRKWNLSDREKKALRALLPKISDKNFGEFTRLVDNLIIIQLQISPDKDNRPLTPGELKKELKKIQAYFDKAVAGMGYLYERGISPSLFDQHYLIANKHHPRKAAKGDLSDKPHVSSSYVEQITRSLSYSMEGFAASCEPKGGRNKDKRFHVLIIEIANFFKLYLPNSAISKYPNTHFSRVVTYILTDVLDERYSEYKGPEDPERRIEGALKEFHARVN
jgi:hypothetical protein